MMINEIDKANFRCNLLSRIPILTYHKIAPWTEFGINVLSPQRFRQQVALFHSMGYRTITFQELLSDHNIPEKSIIVTFDDAYQCVHQNAFPILSEFGFRAVVFVVAGFINKMNEWDANFGAARFRHMSAEQLREISQAGWEIGAHGMTHRSFPQLKRKTLERELSESRRILEPISLKPIVSIAYPFGRQNRRIREMVKQAGYVFGCKGIRGQSRNTDLHKLTRIPVYQFEKNRSVLKKLSFPGISLPERLKLMMLSWPAILTPCYQFLVKRKLFIEW